MMIFRHSLGADRAATRIQSVYRGNRMRKRLELLYPSSSWARRQQRHKGSKRSNSPAAAVPTAHFTIGDRVNVHWPAEGQWYPGRIVATLDKTTVQAGESVTLNICSEDKYSNNYYMSGKNREEK